MLGQDVLLENLPGVAVELEHGGVELQDVLGADLGRGRLLHADDRFEIVRQVPARAGASDPRASASDMSALTPLITMPKARMTVLR